MKKNLSKNTVVQQYDSIFKIILIGDMAVGKTSIIQKLSEPNLKINSNTQQPTVGVDYKQKTVNIEGKRIKLQIWDTAGSERYRSIATQHYRGSHGVVLLYDTTNKSSFENIQDVWMEEVKRNIDDHDNVR